MDVAISVYTVCGFPGAVLSFVPSLSIAKESLERPCLPPGSVSFQTPFGVTSLGWGTSGQPHTSCLPLYLCVPSVEVEVPLSISLWAPL